MKMTKNGVTKEIAPNVASLYASMGWKEAKEEKPKNNSFVKPKIEETKIKEENKEF